MKTNLTKTLILAIVPIVMFITIKNLKQINGDYYLWQFDQPYSFLSNVLNNHLNISEGFENRQGATIQVSGLPAVLFGLTVANAFYIVEGKDTSLVNDGLKRPEVYLSFLNSLYLLLSCGALCLLGWLVMTNRENIWESVFIQLSLFTSLNVMLVMVYVSLESFQIIITLVLAALLCHYYFKSSSSSVLRFDKLGIGISILIGTAIATKLNYFPLFFLPFFLFAGIKNKLYYSLIVVLVYFVFTIPLLLQNSGIFKWILKLFIHTGKYGQGEPNIVDTGMFISNCKIIISSEEYFIFSIILSLTSLLLFKLKSPQVISAKSLVAFKIVLGSSVSSLLNVFIVSKHHSAIYLIPSLILSNFSIYFSLQLFSETIQLNLRQLHKLIFPFLIIANTLYAASKYADLDEIIFWNNKESVKTERFLEENYSKDLWILAYSSSHPESAISYMTVYNSGTYKKILEGKLKNKIYFSPWTNSFRNLCNEAEATSIIRKHNKLIYLTRGEESVIPLMDSLKHRYGIKTIEHEEVFRDSVNHFVYEIKYQIDSTKRQ